MSHNNKMCVKYHFDYIVFKNYCFYTISEESQELIAEADIDGGRYKIVLTI